jgi:hypothetical protein
MAFYGSKGPGPIGWFRADGWPGVLGGMLTKPARKVFADRPDDYAQALWEAVLFERYGFGPDWCAAKAHWFFRPLVGRRPDACILHAEAMRKARWRDSVTRQLKDRAEA